MLATVSCTYSDSKAEKYARGTFITSVHWNHAAGSIVSQSLLVHAC
jgi:hypothetical protein